MYNVRNAGQVIGLIAPAKKGSTDAITFFKPNSDGSQRIALSVLVSDNFKSRYTQAELDAMPAEVRAKRVDRDGRGYKSQRISLTKFLPYDKQRDALTGIAAYNTLKPGDMVAVSYSVKTSVYEKNGEPVYSMNLEIENLQVLRHATTTAASAPAAEAPAAAPAADTGVAENYDPSFEGFSPDDPF